MLRKLNQKAAAKTLTFASMFVCIAGVSAPAFSESVYHYAVSGPDPIDYEFRQTHPFKVFVVTGARNGHNKQQTASYIKDHITHALPSYVALVSDRRNADMVINAETINYQLSFHVTDIDYRNKKYKNRNRNAGGQCGLHQRAFYTRITEKGVALADYKLSVRLRGAGRYQDTVRIVADESFRHGKDLRAQTNCGVQPTVHFPNSAVANLFARSGEGYKQSVAFDIHKEATRKLATVIAQNINSRSEQFYANLAAQYAYSPARYESGERRHIPADIYDHDHEADDPWSH